MKQANRRRRHEAANCFDEAAKLAEANGMVLAKLAYAGNPNDVTQYRLTGPRDAWYKDLYPGPQRIFCPDKSKQGPFISMRINQRWNLVDIVRACIKAISKEQPAQALTIDSRMFTGDSDNTQAVLTSLITAVSVLEGTDMQGAIRDVMTDLRHVSDKLQLDFHMAEDGSYEVYLEEKVEDKGGVCCDEEREAQESAFMAQDNPGLMP